MAEKKATAKGAAKSKKPKAASSAQAEAAPVASAKAAKAKRPKVAQKTSNRFSRAALFQTFVPSGKASRRCS